MRNNKEEVKITFNFYMLNIVVSVQIIYSGVNCETVRSISHRALAEGHKFDVHVRFQEAPRRRQLFNETYAVWAQRFEQDRDV